MATSTNKSSSGPPPVKGYWMTITLADFPLISVMVKRTTLKKSESGRLQGHRYCPEHNARVKQVYRCEQDGEVLERTSDGYEWDGKVVIVEKDSLGVPSDKRLELKALVDRDDVDRLYVDSSYALSAKAGHEGAFDLLTAAMRESGKYAIGTAVMVKSTKVVVLRYSKVVGGLVLDTCVYDARVGWGEVRLIQESQAARPQPTKKQAKETAELLAAALSDSFDLNEVTDEYKENLERAVAAAAAGLEAPVFAKEVEPVPTIDLTEALRAEVAKKAQKREKKQKVKV